MPKKEKQSLKPIIFLLILLVLLFIIIIAAVRMSFLLGYDLSISLSPGDISLQLTNNQPVELTFNLETSNKIECTALCEYSFKDLSNNDVIESETVILEPKQTLSRNYSLVSPELGTGQKIYNFEVKCKNQKSLFCPSAEKNIIKSSLVTLNYDLTTEEKIIKPVSKEKLENLLELLREADLGVKESNQISEIIYSNEIEPEKIALTTQFDETSLIMENLKYLWAKEYYTQLYLELNQSYEDNLTKLNNDIYSFNQTLAGFIKINDYFIDFFNKVMEENQSLAYYINQTEDYGFINNFNNLLDEFNTNNFSDYSSLFEEIKGLEKDYNSLNLSLVGNETYDMELMPLLKDKILLNNLTIESNIETRLSENKPVCCIFGECNPCCNDESCSNDPKTFPIIFIHGHAVNKDTSPEQMLNSFDEIQSKFAENGYINAGIITAYSKDTEYNQGEWGLSGKPITVRATYYYELVEEDGKLVLTPRKSDDIDVYAERLKYIIDLVKYRTGKSKVNIVAHSMGGLVSREYLKKYGEDSVNKLILIGTPNNGITTKIYSLCRILGEKKECDQMKQGSSFLYNLNNFKLISVAVYTISGRGCDMDGLDGDGIVLFESSKMDNVKDFEINGICPELLSYLHSDMLDPEKYPETYKYLEKILND
ncbi:MAG: alpha/beta fold hydrolase [Candidatus Nanoarchaeia archaeon]|nr:alpha/beta fold hydrolase [Candidatus Nanoarchaeia archaeon]